MDHCLPGLNISDKEFKQFQMLLREIAGISLSTAKKALVMGRLAKRLQAHQLKSYRDYFNLVTDRKHEDELQVAVDLLTTNETSFFREPSHFDFLRQVIAKEARPGRTFRVWSAASSSGEEAYSLAMVLADSLGEAWEVVASDICTRVLERARAGQYSIERSRHIPPTYLSRYCLKGVGSQSGTFIVDLPLRDRVRFLQINLNRPLPSLGEFDVIFLRNVMIYFDTATKQEVVGRLTPVLRAGGYFLIGHSESLSGVTDALKLVTPSVYRKP